MTVAAFVVVVCTSIVSVVVIVLIKVLLVLDAMQDNASVVATNLARAQAVVDSVAFDLDVSHRKADAVREGAPGEAADAASKSGEPRKPMS